MLSTIAFLEEVRFKVPSLVAGLSQRLISAVKFKHVFRSTYLLFVTDICLLFNQLVVIAQGHFIKVRQLVA
ncbi:hypothetical protein KIN20_026925 [Parelaphostrongylus tenuis]|uniref:Uncharacterized protein n=1 Tax=Parelaphostrongylus tenuis TaxID=148309 RepID=A0AAD5QYM4_PARTN|nr:hypothetical protein KIN20_026925 [Parelaphostrongylus tenuis]